MNIPFLINYIIHTALTLAAACGLVYWILQIWAQTPATGLVRLVRHPAHFWIACVLALIPSLFGTALVALVFSGEHPERMARIMVPVFYILSLFYGGLFGLAAACCAGSGERFHLRGALVTAVALVLAPPWYMAGSLWIFHGIRIFILIVIVAVACFVLVDKRQMPLPSGAGAPPPLPPKSSPWPALLVGFTPALLILLTITLASSGVTNHMSNDESRALLWLASIASVACCIIASVMLFKRKTGAAIACAVMLLLLNVFLSFFFGCCASFVGASFR